MSDCSEDFKALKQYHKDNKEQRRQRNMVDIDNSKIDYRIDGNGSVVVTCGPGKAIFYPSANKWQHLGRTYYGSAKDFLSFILG